MAPAGLSAVLRSRHTNSVASQGSLSMAALRGTCSYPWRRAQCVSYGATTLIFKGSIAKSAKTPFYVQSYIYNSIESYFYSKIVTNNDFIQNKKINTFW